MATAQDYINAVQAFNPGVDLSSVLGPAANNALSSNQPIDSFVSQYGGSNDVLGAYNKQQQALYAPQVASINGQIGVAQQQGQLNNQQNALQQSITGQGFDNSAFGIRQGANQANNTVLNTAAGSGLQRSGFAALGQNTVGTQESQALSYNDAQRADALASLAIQNQQGNLQTQANTGQLQGQLAGINATEAGQAETNYLQANAAQQANQQSVFQAVSSPNILLLSTSPAYANAYAQMLAKAGLGTANVSDIMSAAKQAYANGGGSTGGSSTYSSVPTNGSYSGGVPAPSQAPATAAPSSGQVSSYIQSIFKDNPGLVSNGYTESTLIPKLQQAPYNLSYQQAVNLAYTNRKPFEGSQNVSAPSGGVSVAPSGFNGNVSIAR